MITQKALVDIRDSDPERLQRAGQALADVMDADPVFKAAVAVFQWTKQMHLVSLSTIDRILKEAVRDPEVVFAVFRESFAAMQANSGFVVPDLEKKVDELIKPFFEALAIRGLFVVRVENDGTVPGVGNIGTAGLTAADAAGNAGSDQSGRPGGGCTGDVGQPGAADPSVSG